MSKIPTNIFHLQPQPKLCAKIRQARHQRTIANCQHTISYKQTVSPSFFINSGKLLLLPYTKGFGRITHFLGNDLATVLYTAFCLDLLFKQLVGYKCTKDIGTIIQKREKASTLL